VTNDELDFAVGRILTTEYKLGVIDHPLPPRNMKNAPGWDSPDHQKVALKALWRASSCSKTRAMSFHSVRPSSRSP